MVPSVGHTFSVWENHLNLSLSTTGILPAVACDSV